MDKFFGRLSQALQKNKAAASASLTPVAAGSQVTPAIGDLVDGRYRVEAEIGRGGMGIVYRAFDIPNKRDAAIKVINFEKANALTLQQFAREAAISVRLRHPHIIAVYETGSMSFGAGPSIPFIAMELAQGISLDQLHGLTYARLIEVAKQICDALGYIHEQGFVYRDVKPANVLLEKRGFHFFVRLMDFGLARPRGEAYLPHESCLAGSVFYLAPELIAGQPADIGSDLYALGATLYEMITGRVPFSDIDEQNILIQHVESAVTPPGQSRADLPPALEAIVLRLLAKNPAERFASAQEVCLALEQVEVPRERGAVLGNLTETPPNAIGRENEVAQVQQLVESNQLVTLLGDDGSLARFVGSRLADQFADGVWQVQLDLVDEPAMVLPAVMSVLGIDGNADRPPVISLVEGLQQKNLLLLLLHCDHVRGACAQLAETLLGACSDVRILATSAQPLNARAEKTLSAA